MKTNELPSKEYLEECFTYDPETGKLYWRFRPETHFKNKRAMSIWNGRFPGSIALDSEHGDGYKCGKLNSQPVKAHRIIYKLLHGIDPEVIDHVKGETSDNKITNIESVSVSENNKNRKTPFNNTSGVIGVSWHDKANKWHARIGINGKQKHLGLFDDFQGAVDCRRKAEVEYGYHTNHGRQNNDL